MRPIVGEILIDAPAEVVFDYVADERNEPTYNPRMLSAEKVTPGPVAAGTRFAALMRTPGRPTPLIVEYTVVERPRALASVSRMPGMEVSGGLTFEPEGRGTRMRWSWDVRCLGWRRVAGPIVHAVGDRGERAIWAGLRDHLEASPPPAGGGGAAGGGAAGEPT